MQTTIPTSQTRSTGIVGWLRANRALILVMTVMVLFPFIIALIDGQSIGGMLNSETGNAKFLQGLMIEVFILAIFALSYDLILGITGLLSFGHAMFFAVGAYLTGIALKSFDWSLPVTFLALSIAAVLQALLFGLVLARVEGITFALVTLGFASVFFIVVQSTELQTYTGADVGLQGVIAPEFLSTSNERFRLYMICLFTLFFTYLIYRRFVDSPTGRVCVAIRENEERAQMLGYNTWYFKLVALTVSSFTAVAAGFLHTIHQPIVSPNVASLGWTVAALLIILIGGVGTLSGAIVGAAIFRLLEYYLDRWFGEVAAILLGAVYILIVLFLPFGVVGTWRARHNDIARGRANLLRLLRLDRRSSDKTPPQS
ncbi:MAG: branched-chain amino acid ABC transporter permease [Anaerolineae bacterium]|nr:branched-chain amino acid ABC transporter permease [Anaerolineae bacterium]